MIKTVLYLVNKNQDLKKLDFREYYFSTTYKNIFKFTNFKLQIINAQTYSQKRITLQNYLVLYRMVSKNVNLYYFRNNTGKSQKRIPKIKIKVDSFPYDLLIKDIKYLGKDHSIFNIINSNSFIRILPNNLLPEKVDKCISLEEILEENGLGYSEPIIKIEILCK